jgi:large subunit ribosomal protein L23
MKDFYDIIRKPSLTEKAMSFQDYNKVVVEVNPQANKIEIKSAMEKLFNVKVKSVHTINQVGKKRRVGKHMGRTADWKKAVVTLAEGQKLDFLENL